MAVNSNSHIPISMLATEVTFRKDGTAEMVGYWYYKEKNLPESKTERQAILAHWLNDRCCKLRLIGSVEQIEDILRSCEWDPNPTDTSFQNIEDLIETAKKHRSFPIEVDRLEDPKATVIPVNVSVRLKRAMESVIAELHLDNGEITLEIAYDWNLEEEIRNFLKGRDN